MTPNDYNDAEFVKLREKVHSLEIDVARLQEKSKAAHDALAIASAALEHNQAVSNEWRKENIDQRALFMTDDKVRGLLAEEASERRAVEGRVTVLEKSASSDIGKRSAFDAVWVKGAVIATLILTGIGVVYKFITGK